MLRGHGKGVYGLIFLPGTDYDNTGGNKVGQSAGDILITGSADMTARSWSLDDGSTLKVGGFVDRSK